MTKVANFRKQKSLGISEHLEFLDDNDDFCRQIWKVFERPIDLDTTQISRPKVALKVPNFDIKARFRKQQDRDFADITKPTRNVSSDRPTALKLVE